MWRYFISLKLVWKYGMNWEQNCPVWDFHVYSYLIIWAYARVQIKHALSISSDPRAAVGTNTTLHTHTHTHTHAHAHFAIYPLDVLLSVLCNLCTIQMGTERLFIILLSIIIYNPKPSLSPLQKWTCLCAGVYSVGCAVWGCLLALENVSNPLDGDVTKKEN